MNRKKKKKKNLLGLLLIRKIKEIKIIWEKKKMRINQRIKVDRRQEIK